MLTVGIKALKNKLSEYVRLASAGETVLISDRDRVVAELGPPSPVRERSVSDALLAEATRSGFISPALGPPGPPPAVPGIAGSRQLLADLDADRQDR